MEKTVHQQLDERDRMSEVDFIALFAELDCDDTVAPIDLGLRRLCVAIDDLRRREGAGQK